MTSGRNQPGDEPAPPGRFDDDLIGLDPDDPEAQAFAAHLDRMEHPNSKATVEGMLQGVDDFAQSINRSNGHRWLVAVLVVTLILFGVAFTVTQAVGFMAETFFG